jgi:hypothetical protein
VHLEGRNGKGHVHFGGDSFKPKVKYWYVANAAYTNPADARRTKATINANSISNKSSPPNA